MKFIKCECDNAVNIDHIVYARELQERRCQHIHYFVELKDTNGTAHRYNGTLEEFIEEIRRTSEDG